MQVVLLSLIPLFAWGVGDYLGSKVTQKVNPLSLGLFFALGGLLASFSLLIWYPFPSVTSSLVLFGSIASLLLNLGFVAMLRGFTAGPVGIVAPISNAYAIIVAFIEVIFLGVSFSWLTAVSIMVVVSGIALVSYSKPTKSDKAENYRTPILWSFLALLLFGIGFIFFGKATAEGEWHSNVQVYEVINFLIALIIWLVLQGKNRIQDITHLFVKMPYALSGGVAGYVGLVALFYVLERTDTVAVPAAISAAAPLVTVLLAYIIDKEHLSKSQRFGSGVIICGIILLSI